MIVSAAIGRVRGAATRGVLTKKPSHLQYSYMALSTFFRTQMKSNVSKTFSISHHRIAAVEYKRHLSTKNDIPSATSNGQQRTELPQQSYDQTARSEHDRRDDALPTSPKADLAKRSKDDVQAHLLSFPESIRRLALSLPTSGIRRPTKDECVTTLCGDAILQHPSKIDVLLFDRLLAGTSSFLDRLRIRFKWFTIRGFRRFRADDWSAFASWIVGGVGIWVIVGT